MFVEPISHRHYSNFTLNPLVDIKINDFHKKKKIILHQNFILIY